MSHDSKGFVIPHNIPGTKIQAVEGDVLNIADRIREYNDNLQLGWNVRRQVYEVKFFNKFGKWVLVKTIPKDEPLGQWVVDELRFADVENGNFSWQKLVEAEEKYEAEQQAKIDEEWAEADEMFERELSHRGIKLAPKISMYRSNKERKLPKVDNGQTNN